jgi:hypothetical protein
MMVNGSVNIQTTAMRDTILYCKPAPETTDYAIETVVAPLQRTKTTAGIKLGIGHGGH